MDKLRAVILGSGNIGTDLMVKLQRSSLLSCAALVGRTLSSPGLAKAEAEGVNISADGIGFIEKNPHLCDIVFDATSAAAHSEHAPVLKELGKLVIDLTPAKIGPFCVPSVNSDESFASSNINMVTCGGQASVPIAHALSQTHDEIEYLEVVSSIASRSAGPATRRNLDEYIHTTEAALRQFSRARFTKAILNLNPAVPCINMQTTLFARVKRPNVAAFAEKVSEIVSDLQRYIPGYEIIVPPKMDGDRVAVMLKVTGRGDYLPSYAGNLDIINCAAVAVAERYAKNAMASAASSSQRLRVVP